MSELRQAAEMALEALDAYSWEQVDAATKALRQALAEEDADEKALWGERQEPVAWFIQYSDSHEFSWDEPSGWQVQQALAIEPLYTATPQKQWVGLTDEEYKIIHNKNYNYEELACAIEAKLKEKNT